MDIKLLIEGSIKINLNRIYPIYHSNWIFVMVWHLTVLEKVSSTKLLGGSWFLVLHDKLILPNPSFIDNFHYEIFRMSNLIDKKKILTEVMINFLIDLSLDKKKSVFP